MHQVCVPGERWGVRCEESKIYVVVAVRQSCSLLAVELDGALPLDRLLLELDLVSGQRADDLKARNGARERERERFVYSD